jgi:hypothetical protein
MTNLQFARFRRSGFDFFRCGRLDCDSSLERRRFVIDAFTVRFQFVFELGEILQPQLLCLIRQTLSV